MLRTKIQLARYSLEFMHLRGMERVARLTVYAGAISHAIVQHTGKELIRKIIVLGDIPQACSLAVRAKQIGDAIQEAQGRRKNAPTEPLRKSGRTLSIVHEPLQHQVGMLGIPPATDESLSESDITSQHSRLEGPRIVDLHQGRNTSRAGPQLHRRTIAKPYCQRADRVIRDRPIKHTFIKAGLCGLTVSGCRRFDLLSGNCRFHASLSWFVLASIRIFSSVARFGKWGTPFRNNRKACQ